MMDRKKLAAIHIVKKELNLSDEVYRNILEQVAGVRSSKDLSDEQFQKLMRYFVRSKYYRTKSDGITIRQKLFIKYLIDELNCTENHLQNFIFKYYRTDNIDTLTKKIASKVIESLKNIKQHRFK
jgi:hypothetical protein